MIWDWWTFIIGFVGGFFFYVISMGFGIKYKMQHDSMCPVCNRATNAFIPEEHVTPVVPEDIPKK